MKKILLAYDGSSSADRAAAIAGKMADCTGAELIIVTILEEKPDGDLQAFSRAEGATLGDVVEPLVEARLAHARQIAEKAGASTVATEVKLGDPAEAILDCARALAADTVVVGKRGRGRLKGLLIGSVSQKLVSLCECPVVVVP
jgi:nucleotide-binding universal stress UspA family protein